jgi:DNA repair exonuclease SbcCD ATPase subunit
MEKILPGLITGGSTAIATVLKYLGGIKDDIKATKDNLAGLEKRFGQVDPDTGKRSGLLGVIADVQNRLNAIEEALEEIKSSRSGSGFNSTDFSMFEERLAKKLQGDFEKYLKTPSIPPKGDVDNRIRALEARLEEMKERESAREADFAQVGQKVSHIQGSLGTLQGILEKLMKLR